jgi:glycosyltransferase involved in cell wall biosynthesis
VYHARFVVAGDTEKIKELFNTLPHIEVCPGVSFEDRPKLIQQFSIGVMPLLDNEFARGKCSMKLLEYMACGIPSVGSRVGENRHVITEGENGFLASSAEEWADVLEHLLTDSKLRERIGHEGRRTVETQYSYAMYIKKLEFILELKH